MTKYNKKKSWLLVLSLLLFFPSTVVIAKTKVTPSVYIVGDSTVKNGKDKGDRGQWGWGHFIPLWFDIDRILFENHAMGGRSSRSFINEGRWDEVCKRLKKGDYVLIQMGHNDGGELNTGRARASLKGIGEEYEDVVLVKPDKKEDEGKHERVYTYGYYLRKYINETKAKGAFSIICSPVPRNRWENNKIARDANYPLWAKQVAEQEKVPFIDLHKRVADKYDVLGEVIVKDYFSGDHTHTSLKGAELNAQTVAEEIWMLKSCKLRKYLKKGF